MATLNVREFRGPVDPIALAPLAADARVQWRVPLDSRSLGNVAAWLADHPDAGLQLRGQAVAQLRELADVLPKRLVLDGFAFPAGATGGGRVRCLEIAGMPRNLQGVLDAFPQLRALRIAAQGESLDRPALAGRTVRILDLSRVNAGADLKGMSGWEPLSALRLYRLPGLKRLDGIENHPGLCDLALCGLMAVDDLAPLAALPMLRALELTGMWQFDLTGVDVLARLPRLADLRIDIGGRRKNVEVYKRLALPQPGPFGRSGFEAA